MSDQMRGWGWILFVVLFAFGFTALLIADLKKKPKEQHEFICIRGVTFARTDSGGLAWVPKLDGRPMSCVEFGGPEIQIPEKK